MNQLLTGIALVSVLFSYGGSKESTDASESTSEVAEAENIEIKVPKFEDKDGCSKHANLFEALIYLNSNSSLLQMRDGGKKYETV